MSKCSSVDPCAVLAVFIIADCLNCFHSSGGGKHGWKFHLHHLSKSFCTARDLLLAKRVIVQLDKECIQAGMKFWAVPACLHSTGVCYVCLM
jgi:hypothetical protein